MAGTRGEFVASSQFTTAPAAGLWFVFRERALLVDARMAPPEGSLPAALGRTLLRTQYLGTLGDVPCFAGQLPHDAPPPAGMQFMDLRALYGVLEHELLVLAGRAVQIAEWDRTHQFCGACGGKTTPHGQARARTCPACGLDAYPRVSPAMIVCVERGPEVLLARSPHFPEGIYSTLAGFVDPGESVEQAVHREVFEETGVRVTNLRYYGSQPWPFPNSLMLGFWADYAGGEIVPEPGEIEHAAFFHVDALPKMFPGRFSVAKQLVADFCERHGRALP
jgi:NAD+ diphosphatase